MGLGVGSRYAAVAVFFARTALGLACEFASAFRFAQYAFIFWPSCFRCAAVNVRFFRVGSGAAVDFDSAFRFAQ